MPVSSQFRRMCTAHRSTSGFAPLRKARQGLVDIGPGDGSFCPCLATGLDLFRLVQGAGFEEEKIGTFLGPGKEGRAAMGAKLARDLPAAVGEAGIAFYLAGKNAQLRGLDEHADGVGTAGGLLAVVTVTIAGGLRITQTLIPNRPTKTRTPQHRFHLSSLSNAS